mgnify:CR=1 FL=1
MTQHLQRQGAELAALAKTIRTGLDQDETSLPAINASLASLASCGIVDHEIDGPTIYCRPRGLSSQSTDELVLYRASLVLPAGLGVTLWDAQEYAEHANGAYGEPVDLSGRFVPYCDCPPVIRALLVGHAGELIQKLVADVRVLGV